MLLHNDVRSGDNGGRRQEQTGEIRKRYTRLIIKLNTTTTNTMKALFISTMNNGMAAGKAAGARRGGQGIGTFWRLRMLFFLAAAMFGVVFGAGAQTFSYNYQTPLPMFGGGASAYGNGVYVVVGSGGYIYRSTNGFNWAVATNSTFINTNYTGVCFAQGLFVATASSGAIATSSNGLNWSLQNSGTSLYAYEAVYLNGRFFVTCSGSTILTSTNATNWVSQLIPGSAYNEFYSLTYGDGKYLMSDDNQPPNGGDANYYIYSSTTGTNGWTSSQITGKAGELYNFIGYLGGKFYTFLSDASIYTSPDGSTWTKFTTAPIASAGYQMSGGIYTNNTYYFFGYDSQSYGSFFSSTNGTNFTELPKGMSDATLNLTYANGVFIQTGNAGFASSTNASNWKYASGDYYGAAYNGTNYVVVGAAGSGGDGYIAVSPDWVNWTNVTPSWLPYFTGVAYGDGKFVAVGSPFTKSYIALSTNGIDWTTLSTGTNETFDAVATDGNGTFVAVGASGDVLRSANNGVTWALTSPSASAGTYFYSISYVNSQFVAVGYGGIVMYSSNGSTWSNANYSDTSSSLTGITYGNGLYVLVGTDVNYNTLYLTRSSLTSGSWSVPGTPPPAIPSGIGELTINYGGGVFMGYYDDTNYDGYIFTSTNGTTWTQHDLGLEGYQSPSIYAGIYANGAFRFAGFYDYTATATAILARAPGITSASTAAATYGSTFNYTITASNSPTSFGASGLPTGLAVNTTSGLISGKPTQSGTYSATISATNTAGFGTGPLTITVAKANLTVSEVVAENKIFNGTSTDTLNLAGATLAGVVNSDSIAISSTGYTANFATTNVGNSLPVTVSGLSLTGTEATNYTLTQPTGLTADITPATATVTLNQSVQLYDGAAKSVTATTVPAGLPLSITYNGSTTAPSASAAYKVVATVTSPNYSGSATNYLYLPETPVILSVSTNGDNALDFTWSAMAQVNYQVVYCPDSLNPPITWANLNGPVTATDSVMTATDPLVGTNRFYRVELLLQ